MPRLIVKNFSCIKSANLETGPFTVIIGPQASGKSVLSKLLYFFTEFFSESTAHLEEGLSLTVVKKRLLEDFSEWFPPTAWGDERFSIQFTMGTFEVRLLRKVLKKEVSDQASITFSKEFETFYSEHSNLYANIETSEQLEQRSALTEFESRARFNSIASDDLKRRLGKDFVATQTFIPAGRSFFTSIGKMMLVIEHTRFVDKITAEFGRRYASARERLTRLQYRRHVRVPRNNAVEALLEEILGGKIIHEPGKDFLRAKDGRLIPFSALSSGQQELLPLAMILQSLSVPLVGGSRTPPFRRQLYIEEPEAHLFPKAQNALVEILCSLVQTGDYPQDLLVTTHSPYVLVKINNLIKAGHLAAANIDSLTVGLRKLYRTRNWLASGSVNAYAIIDGVLTLIIDDEGFIDGDYLDDVSGDIAREFNQLLQLESDYVR